MARGGSAIGPNSDRLASENPATGTTYVDFGENGRRAGHNGSREAGTSFRRHGANEQQKRDTKLCTETEDDQSIVLIEF